MYKDSNNCWKINENGYRYLKNKSCQPVANQLSSEDDKVRQGSAIDDTFGHYSASSDGSVILYQEKLIQSYEERISFLEEENKKLLDIISLQNQTELAKNIEPLQVSSGENKNNFFWTKFWQKFKK